MKSNEQQEVFTDHRPLTTDHRPLTTAHRSPKTNKKVEDPKSLQPFYLTI
jgi:hypothetical protein